MVMVEVEGEPDLIMRCAVDTGAELNLVGAAWLSTLQLVGYAKVEGTPIEVEWVSDARFTVDQAVLLQLKISGTHQHRETLFMVAPESVAVEGLLIGWPEIQLWGLLPHLDGVMVMQRE